MSLSISKIGRFLVLAQLFFFLKLSSHGRSRTRIESQTRRAANRRRCMRGRRAYKGRLSPLQRANRTRIGQGKHGVPSTIGKKAEDKQGTARAAVSHPLSAQIPDKNHPRVRSHSGKSTPFRLDKRLLTHAIPSVLARHDFTTTFDRPVKMMLNVKCASTCSRPGTCEVVGARPFGVSRREVGPTMQFFAVGPAWKCPATLVTCSAADF